MQKADCALTMMISTFSKSSITSKHPIFRSLETLVCALSCALVDDAPWLVHGVYFYGILRWYNECMSVFDLHITNGLERSQISRELVALYIHRILAGAGNAIAGVFTVVFVYQYFGNSLWAALYAYGAIYLGTALITPISARLLRSLGTRRLMVLALPCMAAGVWALYLVQRHAGGGPYLVGVVG